MNVNKIDAQAKSVSDLLSNKKYAIDYYQREYKWCSHLPFRPHLTFKKADLDTRQELYQLICEEIWSPSRFDKELE